MDSMMTCEECGGKVDVSGYGDWTCPCGAVYEWYEGWRLLTNGDGGRWMDGENRIMSPPRDETLARLNAICDAPDVGFSISEDELATLEEGDLLYFSSRGKQYAMHVRSVTSQEEPSTSPRSP